MKNIRNFCIIAHIDHGKSTLADRFLEITGTVPERRMRAQYLDQLELERERGITIKMAPVRMIYEINHAEYILNLIDTPGHSDFSYEVSRALVAVEGAVLLVDAGQGIQAQTLANFRAAKAAGLKIIGAVSKIDLFENRSDGRLQKAIREVAQLLEVSQKDISLVSGKTGEGVKELLEEVVRCVPPPKDESNHTRALVFDSFYDDHKGVVVSVRVFDGKIRNDGNIYLLATKTNSKIKELGYFAPELKSASELGTGEIGYIATGVKDPEKIKIGDTIIVTSSQQPVTSYQPLPGYKEPKPVVFVSFYPEDSNDHELLERGLQKLKLNDSSLTVDSDQNEVLGRGFKVGFLGRLHFEITAERLRREFGISIMNTFPSVVYRVKVKGADVEIMKPEDLPENFEEIWEPMVRIEIIVPENHVSSIFPLQKLFRLSNITTETLQDRVKLDADMPLAELISDFDDKLKSATEGYASFSYELAGYKKSDVLRVDVLISGVLVPGLSRFFPKSTYEQEGREMIKRLKKLLPRQQFTQPVQAAVGAKIIAREDIQALKKNVTGNLYGGDRTRKMKLWQKQKKGKKRLKERSQAKITPDVFKELLKK